MKEEKNTHTQEINYEDNELAIFELNFFLIRGNRQTKNYNVIKMKPSNIYKRKKNNEYIIKPSESIFKNT